MKEVFDGNNFDVDRHIGSLGRRRNNWRIRRLWSVIKEWMSEQKVIQTGEYNGCFRLNDNERDKKPTLSITQPFQGKKKRRIRQAWKSFHMMTEVMI